MARNWLTSAVTWHWRSATCWFLLASAVRSESMVVALSACCVLSCSARTNCSKTRAGERDCALLVRERLGAHRNNVRGGGAVFGRGDRAGAGVAQEWVWEIQHCWGDLIGHGARIAVCRL
ncbi:hypothetical protein BC828DRAFT_376381 [Blastocladiella britannica]|nr:hypothetical protein BC828DRAFT_376381 [Blastocladiella britannica]